MVFQPIHPFSGIEGAVEDLGDLQFVQDRIKAGEWWEVEGDIDTVGDAIEFIPPSGKTAVIFEAKIVISDHKLVAVTGTTSDLVRADLLINTVKKDQTNIGVSSKSLSNPTGGGGAGAGFGHVGDGKFNALGKSLVGDAAKKIEIKNTLDTGGSAHASMSGWLFTT